MGRPPSIDRRTVLEAAVSLADEHGLEGVTMAAVAATLDVTPMALYRHVGNKSGLLDGMVEQLLLELPPPPEGEPWEVRLAAVGDAVRVAARRHPAVFPLLLQRPAASAGARRARSVLYDVLSDAGVAADDVAQIERVVSSAVLGFAASEAAGRFRRHSRAQRDADFAVVQDLLVTFVTARSASRAQSRR